jgi:shikimate dehydrogenase
MNTPALKPSEPPESADATASVAEALPDAGTPPAVPEPVREIGGRRDGTEPTRFGDWEKGGRCIDF